MSQSPNITHHTATHHMLRTNSPLAASAATAAAAAGSLNAIAALVQSAAVKNGLFAREPARSNSLVQTLLQRRHWFNLLALRKEATLLAAAARASPAPTHPARHKPGNRTNAPIKSTAATRWDNLYLRAVTTSDAPSRADAPTPTRRKRTCGPALDGERAGDGLVLVLAVASNKRRRSSSYAAVSRKNRPVFGLR